MTRFYEKGVHNELGENITNELKVNECKFVVNHENLTYAFINCPEPLEKKILIIQELKGADSILNEFRPEHLWSPSVNRRRYQQH